MKQLNLILALLISAFGFAQTDILDARENYGVGAVVTVTGICTNGEEMGSTVRYIEDGTAGIAIYPGSNWNAWDMPQRGDIITVTGTITEFNGLLEVGPSLTSVEINSTGNDLPAPQVMGAEDADEDDEGELVEVLNVQFSNGGTIIAGNSTYDYTADGQTGTIYVRNGSAMIGSVLPAGLVTLNGICSQFDSSAPYDSGYQILARDMDDLILSSSINIIGQVDQTGINYDSIELSWSTDTQGDSKIEWGTTPALGQEVYDATNTTSHAIAIPGLNPGSIYYARVISSNGEDETFSNVTPYATRSESSGTITVYFTQSVNTDYATFEDAIPLQGLMDDTIAAYIARAEHTIDIAIYNFGDVGIANALNAAHAEGIQVRFVGQATNSNMALDNLDAGIPIQMREDDFGSGMHNKFMVIDRDYADKAVVWTGSMNWIEQDELDDYNNSIIFQDQSMARAYTLEFEEMWGSSTMTPSDANSKFGSDKTINTPKKFLVGNSPVEVYFSPSDNANQAILDAIATTDGELNYAVFAATRDDIAEAIIDEDDLFLTTVRGLLEQTSDPSSIYPTLVDANMDVFSHEGISGLLHHKYLMVDPGYTDSDPTVLTGSHNWSNSANTINDENTVVVHDARVANLYLQEFMARWLQVGVNEEAASSFDVYPNPADVQFMVNVPASLQTGVLIMHDLTGREVNRQIINHNQHYVQVENLTPGVYTVTLQAGEKQLVRKVVVR
ncbi:MAG: hypothetical protein RL220_492 [Bacteroidota bacterium]